MNLSGCPRCQELTLFCYCWRKQAYLAYLGHNESEVSIRIPDNDIRVYTLHPDLKIIANKLLESVFPKGLK